MIGRWLARLVSAEIRYERHWRKQAVTSHKREKAARQSLANIHEQVRAALDTATRQRDEALAELEAHRQALRAALIIEPCHITGMHEPDHHTRYLCQDQKAAMLGRVLAAFDLRFEDLSRRLHELCGWCHNVPGQEEAREQLRESHRWAGVAVPPELAGPAPDALRPGDTDVVLACFTDQWRRWSDVAGEVVAATSMHRGRFAAAIQALLADGSIEERWPGSGWGRLAQHVADGEDATSPSGGRP